MCVYKMWCLDLRLILCPGTPALTARIKPGRFPLVLRNLHISAFVLNCSTALLVLALIPLQNIAKAPNILSVLGNVVRLIV
jgi:hypothetical protein